MGKTNFLGVLFFRSKGIPVIASSWCDRCEERYKNDSKALVAHGNAGGAIEWIGVWAWPGGTRTGFGVKPGF